MDERIGQRGRMLERALTRRRLLQGSLAVGGGALATSFAPSRGARRAFAARQDSGFSGQGSITSWGFGVEETNPLAFARVNAFKEAYPNVKLEIVPETDDQKILTAAASDTLPDLFWLDRFTTASWASRNVLMPLTDFIERDAFDTSRFYEAALNEASYDGQLYGIPGGMDVRVLYVNLDALSEFGLDIGQLDTANWDQLNEIGAELTKRSGDRVDRWGFDNKLQSGFLYLWGAGNGGRFLSEDGQETTFDDPKVVEALDWGIKGYEAQGGFQSYEAFATTFQGDEQFARGQVAMTMYENWMMNIVSRTTPDLNFAVRPIKQRGGEGLVSFTGGRAWYIPQGAKDPEAAWAFIKFMHSDETWLIGANAVKAARKEANQPYIPSLTGSKTADQAQIDQVYEPIAAKFDEAVRLFPQLLEQSQNREISNSPVGSQLHDALMNEGVMPALRGERSPQEALEAADTAAQDAIDSM